MYRDAWEDVPSVPCLCTLLTSVPSCLCALICRSVCWTSYIHLISFGIACLCTFKIITIIFKLAHTYKEALPVASNSRVAILHTTEQASNRAL